MYTFFVTPDTVVTLKKFLLSLVIMQRMEYPLWKGRSTSVMQNKNIFLNYEINVLYYTHLKAEAG